jgi:hypothetical protein
MLRSLYYRNWPTNFHLLWNPKLYYRFRNGPPLEPILSQMNLFHTTRHIYLRAVLI